MEIERIISILLIVIGVGGVLLERLGRKQHPLPARLPTVEEGHVPGEGEPFTVSYSPGFQPSGMYISPSANAEWKGKIEALEMVVGSQEWEAYKEKKEAEIEREELWITYGDWR